MFKLHGPCLISHLIQPLFTCCLTNFFIALQNVFQNSEEIGISYFLLFSMISLEHKSGLVNQLHLKLSAGSSVDKV